MKLNLLYIITVMVFIAHCANSQNPSGSYSNNAGIKLFKAEDKSAPAINYQIVNPGGGSVTTGNASATRFIVKLADAGGISTASPNNRSGSTTILDQHSRFRSDLNSINGMMQASRAVSQPVKIRHEYTRTYNGFAIEANEAVRDQILKLDYVISVTEDKQVKAIDLASSEIINADNVWSQYDITGRDIDIGIVDTGIDYMHPDLGGGFGPTFKVKGGYDFVNEDADPMDDHSHGTHVAGIAAANGPGLKGVAPDANLYAFKVLDNFGNGYDSWILAAIERTVDPDQNPATDDKMDVVNMSLGRSIDPEEPISEAVNNAVAQGVVFVVAAGNSYDYGTIGTPAVAADAITVGATDMSDLTANFSSKGPSPNTFHIKPDVAAPGVAIYSSIPGDQYANYDGTSMASPHVAGAVALLLEKHPDWTPAMVKGALMGTAVNTHNELIWHQGAGRIDVLEAIQSEFIFSPGSISLGLADATASTWSVTKTIRLENLTGNSKDFTLSAEGLQVGELIQISLTPSLVTIPANSYQDIEVTFDVEVENLMPLSYPDAYAGFITASSEGKTIKIQYAFMHAPVTKLQLTGELPYAIFAVGTTPYSSFFKVLTPQPDMSVMLPDGTYDFIAAYYDNHYVFKENINPEDNNLISFDKTEADNHIQFFPKDKNGNDLDYYPSFFGSTMIFSETRNYATVYFGPQAEVYVSDMDYYGVAFKLSEKDPTTPSTQYDITLSTPMGISDDIMLTNDASDFINIEFKNPLIDSGEDQGLTIQLRLVGGWSMYNTYPFEAKNPVTILANKHDATKASAGAFAWFTPDLDSLGWETSVWDARHDGTWLVDFWGTPITTLDNTGGNFFTLGSTLPRINAEFTLYPETFYFINWNQRGFINRFYEEKEFGTITYELFEGEQLVDSGPLSNAADSNTRVEGTRADGEQTLKLHFENYFIGGLQGSIDATLKFNTDEFNPYPPYVQLLDLVADGEHTNHFAQGVEAEINISMSDCFVCSNDFSASITTSLYYKNSADDTWIELDLQDVSQNDFKAVLPTSLTDGYYDLKLTASRSGENPYTYEVKPAFNVGDTEPQLKVQLLLPEDDATSSRKPVFEWEELEEASKYIIQVDNDSDFSSPAINNTNVKNENFTTALLLEKETEYFWRVKPVVPSQASAWSSISSFTTDNNDWIPSLLEPSNGADEQALKATLKWSEVDDSGYVLQVAENNEFNNPLVDIDISNTLKIVSLTAGKEYFWRVKSKATNIWSETFSFTTAHIETITLQQPLDNFETTETSLTFGWEDVAAGTYVIEIASDNLFEETVFNADVNDNEIDIDFSAGGIYFWRVRINENEAPWSETRTFTLYRPGISLILPPHMATDVSVNTSFEWVETSSQQYAIEVAYDGNFENLVFSSTTTGHTHTAILDFGTEYFWRVKESGEYSHWSVTRSFSTLQEQSPLEVNLITPANNAFGVHVPTIFSWLATPDADIYELIISEHADLSEVHFTALVSDTALLVTNLNPSTIYYWQVKAILEGAEVFSVTNMFATNIRSIELLQPGNSATNQSLSIHFKWSKSNVTSYLFQISDDISFQSLHSSELVSDTSILISGLAPESTYYWRVKGWINGSEWSDVFHLETIKPVVNLQSPENNATGVDLSIDLVWETIDDADDYTVMISDEIDFSNIIFQQATPNGSINFDDLLPGREYFWKVGATFGNDTYWSDAFAFNTMLLTGVETRNFIGFIASPNPTNGEVQFKFYLNKPTQTSLEIINSMGSSVYRAELGILEGENTALWDTKQGDYTSVSNGIYFVILKTEHSKMSLKLVVSR